MARRTPVLLLSLCLAAPALAQSAASDSIVAGGDPAPADTGATLSPRAALLRSAVLPGWGQASMGHPFKAVLFGGAAAGWLTAAVVETRRIDEAPTPQEHEDRAARRNTRVLYFFVTVTLSALDAYVDAHLDDFEIDANDPTRAGARWTLRFDL